MYAKCTQLTHAERARERESAEIQFSVSASNLSENHIQQFRTINTTLASSPVFCHIVDVFENRELNTKPYFNVSDEIIGKAKSISTSIWEKIEKNSYSYGTNSREEFYSGTFQSQLSKFIDNHLIITQFPIEYNKKNTSVESESNEDATAFVDIIVMDNQKECNKKIIFEFDMQGCETKEFHSFGCMCSLNEKRYTRYQEYIPMVSVIISYPKKFLIFQSILEHLQYLDMYLMMVLKIMVKYLSLKNNF